MSSNTQEFQAIDAELLMEHMGFDKELLLELTEIFREYYPEHLRNLNEAVAQDDCKTIHETAHQLKSAVGNFFATKALELVTEIEKAGIQGRSDLAKDLLLKLPSEVDLMLEELPRLYEDE